MLTPPQSEFVGKTVLYTEIDPIRAYTPQAQASTRQLRHVQDLATIVADGTALTGLNQQSNQLLIIF